MQASSILSVLLLAGTSMAAPADDAKKEGQYGCHTNGEADSSKFCCSTYYPLGAYYNEVGHDDFISDVYVLSSDAFFGGRGNKNPRSLCKTSAKGNVLCVSWATYSGGSMPSGLDNYIAQQTAGCQNPSGSSQFYIRLSDGSSSTLCVSSDPDTCGVYF